MKLILLRHAIAVPADEHPGPDFTRPLTEQGRAKASKAVPGLEKQMTKLDKLYCSPATRTRETAQLVYQCFRGPCPNPEELPLLQGSDYEALGSFLQVHHTGTVLCVGHEPWLSSLASYLFSGETTAIQLPLKKFGALCLEVDPNPAFTVLEWLLLPSQLRQFSN